MIQRGIGERTVKGLTESHDQITKQIRQCCESGMRQMFGLAINNACDFFFALDRDKSGYAERTEIVNALSRLGSSLSHQQLDDWMAWLDKDGSGDIDAIEFISAVDGLSELEALSAIASYKPFKAAKRTRETRQELPQANKKDTHVKILTKKLRKVLKQGHHMINGYRVRSAVDLFNAIDTDHSGSCENHEIVKALNSLHLGVNKHDVMHWIRTVDIDTSGHVDAAEFIRHIVGRPATENELSQIKGGKHVMSNGRKRTDNSRSGRGENKRSAASKMTDNILLALESACKRSMFGCWVTDANSLFHALDRDDSGTVEKDELVAGLRRLGVASSIRQISDWVNHLSLNEEGGITKETFKAALSHASRITKIVHHACHHAQRNIHGMVIKDAASFFFALDQDMSGDLSTEEIKNGLVQLDPKIKMRQVQEFVDSLDKDNSGSIDAIEFVRAVDFVDAKEAEKIVNNYVPVTHKRLLQEERLERERIEKELKHLRKQRRASIAKGGPKNQEEAIHADIITKHINDSELRIQEIGLAQKKREGEQTSNVSRREKSGITAQSRERESKRIESGEKRRRRRESVALVNTLSPKLHRKSHQESQNSETKEVKPVAHQAVSMAISNVLKSGTHKLFGHTLRDAESLFHALDQDFSGDVDRQELRNGLKSLKIGFTTEQLEAWIDALDINGDGSIVEDEFVGFLEGSLDPDLTREMSDMAANLLSKSPSSKSSLLVDKLIQDGAVVGDSETASQFLNFLRQLENLYAQRVTFQQRINSRYMDDPRKAKGIGLDILLDVEIAQESNILEEKLQSLIDNEALKEGKGDISKFFMMWRYHWQARHAVDQNLVMGRDISQPHHSSSETLYEIEMKRKDLKSKPEKKAWVGVASPARERFETFSHPGFLSESWHETKDTFMEKTKTYERTGRFRQKKAAVIGLDLGTSKLSSNLSFHLGNTKQPIYVNDVNYATEELDKTDSYMLAGLPNVLSGLQDDAGEQPGFRTSIEKKPAFISAKERIKAAIDRLKHEPGAARMR